jgi:hypothetical protein
METKLIAMILGVALVLAATTIVTTQASAMGPNPGSNGIAAGGNCKNNDNNPHCNQPPSGFGFGRGFGFGGW